MKTLKLTTILLLLSAASFAKDFTYKFSQKQIDKNNHVCVLNKQGKAGHVLKSIKWVSVNNSVVSVTYTFTDLK